MSNAIAKSAPVLSTLCLTVGLAGCFGGGGGSGGGAGGESGDTNPLSTDTTPPTITITSIGLSGTLTEPAQVQVNNVDDEDGIADQSFRVELPLGYAGMVADPVPTTVAQTSLEVIAIDQADNTSGQQTDIEIRN